jgi:hypothetical protein
MKKRRLIEEEEEDQDLFGSECSDDEEQDYQSDEDDNNQSCCDISDVNNNNNNNQPEQPKHPLTIMDYMRKDIPLGIRDLAHFYSSMYGLACKLVNNGLGQHRHEIKEMYMLMENFLERLKDYYVTRGDALRNYVIKNMGGKWCHATNIFVLYCTCKVIYNQIKNYLEGPTDPTQILNMMDEDELLLDNKKPISKYTQMEFMKQLIQISHKWYSKGYSHYIGFVVSMMEDRASILVTCIGDENEMDGSMDTHKWKLPGGSFCCSREFVDNISCTFQSLYRSMYVRKKIESNCRLITPDLGATIFTGRYGDRNMLVDCMKKWLEKEGETIADDSFKDKLKIACINASLRPGELEIHTRNSGGVKPGSGVSVIEATRPSLQVSWWVTQAIAKGIGIKFNEKLPAVKATTALMLFATYCESFIRFPWANEVVIKEKDYIAAKDCYLESPDPTILQCMGSYDVYYSGTLYQTNCIEETILIWLIIMKNDRQSTYKSNLESWDISRLCNMLDEWTKSSSSSVIDSNNDCSIFETIPMVD